MSPGALNLSPGLPESDTVLRTQMSHVGGAGRNKSSNKQNRVALVSFSPKCLHLLLFSPLVPQLYWKRRRDRAEKKNLIFHHPLSIIHSLVGDESAASDKFK